MDEQVRLGVVGVGAQGRMYAKLVASGRAPSLTLAALCSANPQSTSRQSHQQLAAEMGVPLFTDFGQLLRSGEVEAVVITTPHYQHPQMGIEALQSGVNVLLEKPAGVYTKQVRELLRVADQRRDLTLAMMFNQRANPLYADLKQAIDAGTYGARGTRSGRSPTGGVRMPTTPRRRGVPAGAAKAAVCW